MIRNEAQWRTEFWKALSPIGHQGYSQHDTFRMALETSFRALYGTTLAKHSPEWQANEKAYLAVFNRTSKAKESAYACQAAFAVVQQALEWNERIDFLGPLHMEAGGNKDAGQFFTPQAICDFMAQMSAHDVDITQPTVSVLEPAAGSGAMVLSAASALEQRGVDRLRLRCELWDIDERMAWASYVQTTLCCIPAVVVHGNTLTQERWGTYANPLMNRTLRCGLYASTMQKQKPKRPERMRVVLE